MHWQDTHNLEHYWPEQLAILKRLRVLGVKVFAGNWYDKTLWQGLDLVVADIDNQVIANPVDSDYLRSEFVIAILCSLERAALLTVEKALAEIDNLLGSISGMDLVATPDQDFFGKAWEDRWWLLGIDADQAQSLAKRAARLNVANRDLLFTNLDVLTVAYDNASAQMLAVGAILLYFKGEKYYDFKLLFSEFSTDNVSDWVSAWRFLGQAWFSHDGEMETLSLNYLLVRQPDFAGQNPIVDVLLEKIILFFVWRDYEYLDANTKGLLINKYIWVSLAAGVPVEKCVKLDLAEEQFLDFYLATCSNLTEHLGSGVELLKEIEPNSITVGQFIKNFLAAAGASDLDGYEQASFVRAQIAENHWPVEWEGLLLRVLYLFVHLRECDLIDYKGLLSEAGLVPRPFEWKQIIREDLTPEKLKIIKDWLVVYNRPFTAKMEMIVEFMKVAFDQEPFLSRALALSDLFEGVYGPQLSPLLYFSEEENKWRLNNTLPDRPATI